MRLRSRLSGTSTKYNLRPLRWGVDILTSILHLSLETFYLIQGPTTCLISIPTFDSKPEITANQKSASPSSSLPRLITHFNPIKPTISLPKPPALSPSKHPHQLLSSLVSFVCFCAQQDSINRIRQRVILVSEIVVVVKYIQEPRLVLKLQ